MQKELLIGIVVMALGLIGFSAKPKSLNAS